MRNLYKRIENLKSYYGLEMQVLDNRSREDLEFFYHHHFWPEEPGKSEASRAVDATYRDNTGPYTTNQLRILCIGVLRSQWQEIWAKCGVAKATSFDEGPMLWLTRFTKTEDSHWMENGTPPLAPFPQYEYLRIAMQCMLDFKLLFIPKSREMMTSWLSCGFISWQCQWNPHISWIIQTEKETKAKQLVEYCRILYRNQEPWMRARVRVVRDTANRLDLSNGSWILAVPKGVNQIRLYHPHGYFMDEAAHLPEAEACYNIALPVAKRILAVSSAAPGWFAEMCDI